MDHKIFVTVQGGIADVYQDTVSRNVVVEVLDFDNLEAGPLEEISCWSLDMRQYWKKNHVYWDAAGLTALVRESANQFP